VVRADILLAYGGSNEEFEKLPDVSRVFVTDSRLTTRARGKQNFTGVWRAAAKWLAQPGNESFSHVYFAEFDHLPVVPDLTSKLLKRIEQEQADVLTHGLRRVDGTSHVHYLYHLSDPEFLKFWRRVSVRSDKEVVFHIIPSGSFWTRKAFTEVAAQEEEVPIFVELYHPTLAHHLGFRVRDFKDQNRCGRWFSMTVESARRAECWTIHPIKTAPLC
jgi:hypothetical protein